MGEDGPPREHEQHRLEHVFGLPLDAFQFSDRDWQAVPNRLNPASVAATGGASNRGVAKPTPPAYGHQPKDSDSLNLGDN